MGRRGNAFVTRQDWTVSSQLPYAIGGVARSHIDEVLVGITGHDFCIEDSERLYLGQCNVGKGCHCIRQGETKGLVNLKSSLDIYGMSWTTTGFYDRANPAQVAPGVTGVTSVP